MEDRSKPPPGMMKMKHMGAYFIAVDHWPSGESDAIAAAWAFVDRIRAEARAEGERAGYARAIGDAVAYLDCQATHFLVQSEVPENAHASVRLHKAGSVLREEARRVSMLRPTDGSASDD